MFPARASTARLPETSTVWPLEPLGEERLSSMSVDGKVRAIARPLQVPKLWEVQIGSAAGLVPAFRTSAAKGLWGLVRCVPVELVRLRGRQSNKFVDVQAYTQVREKQRENGL